MKRKTNFTLLEFLIVAGVAALLFSLQLGSSSRSKQSAKFIRWYAFNKQCAYDPDCLINFNFQEKKGVNQLSNSAVGNRFRDCENSENPNVASYRGMFKGDLQWCEGRWGGRKMGLRFNGVNSYVEIDRVKALNFSGQKSFTVLMWVKFDKFRRWDGLFSKAYWGASEAADGQYDLYYDGPTYEDSEAVARFEAEVSQKCVGYDNITVEGKECVSLNNSDWFHIVMRHTCIEEEKVGNIDIFINGKKMVERSTDYAASGEDVCEARLLLGAIRWQKKAGNGQPTEGGRIANHFSGIIDEFIVYGKAVSDNDIKTHYNEGTP